MWKARFGENNPWGIQQLAGILKENLRNVRTESDFMIIGKSRILRWNLPDRMPSPVFQDEKCKIGKRVLKKNRQIHGLEMDVAEKAFENPWFSFAMKLSW